MPTSFSRTALRLLFPILALAGSAAADSVQLLWDANPEPDIAGYRLRYSIVSGGSAAVIETGVEPAITLKGLKAGDTYYCAVQAFDTEGLSGPFSDEISFVVAQGGKPQIVIATPAGASLASGGDSENLGIAEIGTQEIIRVFKIRNDGDAELSGLRATLADTKGFILDPLSTTTLEPGAAASLIVHFLPTSVGSQKSAIKVFSNDPKVKLFTIPLSGTGFRRPEVVVRRTPASGGLAIVAFPGVDVGVTPVLPGDGTMTFATARLAEPPGHSQSPAMAAPPAAMTSPSHRRNAGDKRTVVVSHGMKYSAAILRKSRDRKDRGRQVEVSSDLVNWTSGIRHTQVVRETRDYLLVRDRLPIQPGARRYLRISRKR